MYAIRLSFAFILLGFVALTLIPVTLVRPKHRNNMALVSQVCSQVMLWYWGADIEIENEHRLHPNTPTVMVSNHQDTHDIFFAINVIKKGTVTLGKWEMIYIPVIGWLYYLTGNILIKRKNKSKSQKAMSIAAKRMQQKQLSVLIFPEGTRNWSKPLPFKLGAFKLAIEGQVPVQPICFSLRHLTMNYRQWHSGTIKVKCLEPIPTKGMTEEDVLDLAIQCRKQIEAGCIEISQ